MRIFGTVAALGALALLAATGGCADAHAEEQRGTDLGVTAGDPAPLVRGDLEFGLSLLDAWCADDPAANVVFSPSSLSSGLGMAALGAKGATRAELAKALGWPADPLAALRARTNLLRGLPGVKVSDRIWRDAAEPTEQDYLDRLVTAYRAGIMTLPLLTEPEESRRTINDTIEDETNGLVKDLIPEGGLNRIGWVLTDAVHFKADWRSPFKPENTAPAPFAAASGAEVRAEYLNQAGSFGYGTAQGWTAVRLPYTGGTLSMVALLPDGDGKDCAPPTASVLRGIELREERVEVSLPKVDLSTKAELSDMLAAAGMPEPFADRADFSGIGPSAGKIGFVQHAATLRLDEKGTEAAAATAVGVEATSAAPEEAKKVVFDRPYLLLLRDEATGQPLFLARVADPTRP
ncbi:serpin family protein [Actinocorallia sp. API 0066]|uniref:serpin family protein n=1 Tax=Actinocorallia sp. API 0066 TaxID=2896846 RepID=UPI001E3DC2E1|nr:serpin family protein [Actinocorallia sp. API 0066]MCD0451487.1 serpin family protein [Actinocorallia sp. API 0066]